MTLTGTFVLPSDAVLLPALDIPEQLRRASDAEDGDFALSLRNSRSLSKIVDASAAALIRQFEEHTTIAVAVARFSRSTGGDPEQILEDALPMLRSLIEEGLLVPADSLDTAQTRASLSAGDKIDQWIVIRCVQALEDTEVYFVRGPAEEYGALKIARPHHESATRMLSREARVLTGLALENAPRLLAKGVWRARQYLVTEWFAGDESQEASAQLRNDSNGKAARTELLRFGAAILDAYAALHQRGVVHGDIHSRNVLVDPDLVVKIIDFGMARVECEPLLDILLPRAGVSFFFEPEYAAAALDGHRLPPPTFAGEQYAVAALLYLLITGKHSQDFSVERQGMLRQIATGKVASFADRGLEPWPEVERLLEKALSREPAGRFASMSEFAASWRAINMPASADKPASELTQLREAVLERAAVGGEWMISGFQIAPTASINYGIAGLAYALSQIAASLEDGELLAAADAWAAESETRFADEGAFYNELLDVTAKTVGSLSLYHGPAGLHVANALISQARGDLGSQLQAAERFAAYLSEVLQKPDEKIDLALGSAGSLLGSVFLLDALPLSWSVIEDTRRRFVALGQQLFSNLWSDLASFNPIGANCELANLGMAHGWAGSLYASLSWCAAAGTGIPNDLIERLEQLANLAQPNGHGLQWRWPGGLPMQGWCNGAAGFVFLWTEAYRALGDPKYLALAEGAAWSVWESPSWIGNLCCGLAGQAYALLNLYRNTGNTMWLHRARHLAAGAAKSAAKVAGMSAEDQLELRPESLYKGEVGIAVLDADLRRPLDARMPFFERL
jgi:serine/threonine protein kinase